MQGYFLLKNSVCIARCVKWSHCEIHVNNLIFVLRFHIERTDGQTWIEGIEPSIYSIEVKSIAFYGSAGACNKKYTKCVWNE